MRTRSYAFTLVELLIVMGVLGLLLAIVLPTFGRVMTISRRVACQANLSHIGKAYNARRSDEPTLDRTVFKANHWGADLTPYLGHHPRALYCLEDEEPFDGTPSLKFWVHGRYHMEMSSAYPYWLEGPARDIVGGVPGVWKLNDEDYQALRSSIQERVNIVDLLPMYTPGQNRNLWWYVFEDQRTGEDLWAGDDQDFEDLIVRVLRSRTGSVEITLWKGATIHHFDLIGPDDEVVATDVGDGPSGPWFFPGAVNISYGMNWRAEFIIGGAQKVLVLDYETEVCSVGGDAPPYAGQGWDEMRAPRHFGKSNVLFAGGEIRVMAPDEIDPDIDANDAQYWDPKR